MQKLRGSGSTFSTSGKAWLPFRYSPKIARRNAKLHRMIKAGKLKPMTKDAMRTQAEQAMRDAGLK